MIHKCTITCLKVLNVWNADVLWKLNIRNF